MTENEFSHLSDERLKIMIADIDAEVLSIETWSEENWAPETQEEIDWGPVSVSDQYLISDLWDRQRKIKKELERRARERNLGGNKGGFHDI